MRFVPRDCAEKGRRPNVGCSTVDTIVLNGVYHLNDKLFEEGLAIRKAVLGDEYVAAALESADEFNLPLQQLVTEYCWGAVWGRGDLAKKTRSLLNIAMLSTLQRNEELGVHVKGAIRNGCTKEEIREVLLQVAIYVGVPAAVDSFRVARAALAEIE